MGCHISKEKVDYFEPEQIHNYKFNNTDNFDSFEFDNNLKINSKPSKINLPNFNKSFVDIDCTKKV
jgi:hypothetical protein